MIDQSQHKDSKKKWKWNPQSSLTCKLQLTPRILWDRLLLTKIWGFFFKLIQQVLMRRPARPTCSTIDQLNLFNNRPAHPTCSTIDQLIQLVRQSTNSSNLFDTRPTCSTIDQLVKIVRHSTSSSNSFDTRPTRSTLDRSCLKNNKKILYTTGK